MLVAVTLAHAKLQQKDPAGAENVLKEACAKAPHSAAVAVVLGGFYASQRKVAEAEGKFQEALAMEPNNREALLSLAVLQNYSGRRQDAEQNFKRLSGLPDKEYQPIYAMFLLQQGRRDEAIREFEKLANADPSDRLARTQLISAYQSVGRLQDAQSLLQKVLSKNPKDLDALLQRGELSVAAGKYAEAQVDLNEVRRLNPNAPEVHYMLAKLSRARGETPTARQELSEALRLNPFLLAVRIELAQDLLSDSPKSALDVLNSAPTESQRSSTPVVVQRNWALWLIGDKDEMRTGIDQGLSAGRTVDLLIQDGLWKLRAGQLSSARAPLEEALRLDPSQLLALDSLRQVYTAQQKPLVALQKVKEYAALQPTSAPVQSFLGTSLLIGGDRKGARAAFVAAKAADPRFVEADLSLVQLDAIEGRWDDARKRLEGVISTSGNTTARLWLGVLEERRENHKAAIELLRKVVEAQPDNAQALNNLAFMQAEYGNQADEALKHAEKAVELAPDSATYCDTLGWVLYRKGLYGPAVKYLERASSNKGNVVWKYHLAMAYAKVGDLARGKSVLEAALKLNPNVPEAKTARGVVNDSLKLSAPSLRQNP
jgi:tetratricopeptide (TPR) repeat protein